MTVVIVLLALSALIGFALGASFSWFESRHPAQGSGFFPRRFCKFEPSPHQELLSSSLA
jgi:hypothetical protein